MNDHDPIKGYDQNHFSSAEPLDEKRSVSVLMSSKSHLESNVPEEKICSIAGSNRYDLALWPVGYGESGFGSPYAPTDWPNPGDKWRWKVGNRTCSSTGFMQDKFLFPPESIIQLTNGRPYFAGRKPLQNFIKTNFPNADIDAFFSSFSWNIPSKEHNWGKDEITLSGIHCMEEMAELSGSKSKFRSVGHCKSANKRRCLEPKSCSEPEIDSIIISDGSDAFVPKSISSSTECEFQYESGMLDEDSGCATTSNRGDIVLRPVAASESGEGYPYAPVDFPNLGDNWRWKVGKRKLANGFMQDRFLFPPKRFHMTFCGKPYISSKKVLEDYIRTEFSNANVDALLSSFSWKIPSKDHDWGKDVITVSEINCLDEMADHCDSGSEFGSVGDTLPVSAGEITLSGVHCMEETAVLSRCKSKFRTVDHRKSINKRRCLEAKSCSEAEKDCVIIVDDSDAFVPKSISSSMEYESQYESVNLDEHSSCAMASKRFDLVLRPVAARESGEGLPYAPVDFPNRGDKWRWKVGKRKLASGFMKDRFLFPPKRFNMAFSGYPYISSKQVFENYIRTEFPNANVDALLSSFSWKIPSQDYDWGKDVIDVSEINCLDEMGDHCDSGSEFGSRGDTLPVSAVVERRDERRKEKEEENKQKASKKVLQLISDKEKRGTEEKRRKKEEREMKRSEQDVKKIIKRFPKGVLVDNDCSSPFLTFETTPINKRVIRTRDLVFVNITFSKVKKDILKCRERFRVEEEGTSTPISCTEIGSLVPRQWITGDIIDWYGSRLGEILEKKAAGCPQQFTICNSFFYPLLAADFMKHQEKLRDEIKYSEINFLDRSAALAPDLNKNWTHQISGDILSPLLIPINHQNNHWALFVVRPVERTIDIYEPLYREEKTFRSYDEEVEILFVMLSKYYILRDPTFNLDWVKRVCCGIPKQRNNYDCGVFVMAYMDCICREVRIEFDEKKGSEYFRYIIARDLLEDCGMLPG